MITKFEKDVNNIQSLEDSPTIQTSELKKAFDQAGIDIKTYINDVLTEEADREISDVEKRIKTLIKKNYRHDETLESNLEENEEHTIPDSYTVALGNLDVYFEGNMLILSEHYEELGSGTSNKIRFKFEVPAGSKLTYIIRK